MRTRLTDQSVLTQTQRTLRGFHPIAGNVWGIENREGPYTLRARSLDIAAVAVFVLDNGRARVAMADEPSICSPYQSGWHSFLEQREIKSLNKFLEKNALMLALALDSLFPGKPDQRSLVEAKLNTLTTTGAELWIENWEKQRGLLPGSLAGKARLCSEAFIRKHKELRAQRTA